MSGEKVLSADNQQGRLRYRLKPWYVTGFVDGEGSFHIAAYKDPRMTTGWKIIPEFHVSQRISSRRVLDALVSFFRCGYVKANHPTNPRDSTYVYVVRDRNDLLTKIIPFFRAHALCTEKVKDFQIFAEVVRMMSDNQHRRKDGLMKIIKLAYTMNGAGRYRKRPLDEIK
ncbi:LAGLIDADG family homing endonuclease [Candidatus Uhrbacteria bacterium]|nr:LAGLIDADG family homing endonuclease [Candidatus Uhrbacteria bacterium]